MSRCEAGRGPGVKYVTSLTDPEVRKLLAKGVLQLGMFHEEVTEAAGPDGVRYVLRRNPAMVERTRTRRADQLRKVREKVDARSSKVAESPEADPEVSLRAAVRWSLADPSLGLWRLPTRWAEPERLVLSVLPPLHPPVLSLPDPA